MRVLVTGHDGYIGAVLLSMLEEAGHDVVGLDVFWFEGCNFGDYTATLPALRMDVRDVQPRHLDGYDAVIHLAAISNDPLGNLDPSCTYSINHGASVHLAAMAKQAGVSRFLFASSCSLYGAAPTDAPVPETAPFNPVTPYGHSKMLVEGDVARLGDDSFSPTFLRNATAYGASPKLRMDVVVNNLVGYALTTGEVTMMSDGSPWRPLVHVEDIARAFRAMLEAPRELVHGEAFNVGRDSENYQIREVANAVAEAVPGSSVRYAEGGGPDLRSYRVDFSKLTSTFPDLNLQWDVPGGILQLVSACTSLGLTKEDFLGSRFIRLHRVAELLAEGHIDSDLRPSKARLGAPHG